eukprot:7774857-Pyramimonas_sp.AAC.1
MPWVLTLAFSSCKGRGPKGSSHSDGRAGWMIWECSMGSQGAILEELVDPVPWFNDRGERVFRRHSVNRKTMMSTRRECMHGILKDGIIKGARAGAVFAVPSTVDRKSWVLWQIGAATLFEALYDALVVGGNSMPCLSGALHSGVCLFRASWARS